MTLSTQAAKRRGSALETLNNPLEQFSNGPSSSSSSSSALENHELKIENLVDTVKIESDELMDIINSLQRVSDNTTRIRILHTMKVPYLFMSSDLLRLLEVTASVKTRIAFINEIGPRLIDPKAKATEIIDLFRYVDDRTQVEEILKARAVTVAKMSAFQSTKPLIGGRGSIGGRGGSVSGGRGRGGRLSGRGSRPSQINLQSSAGDDDATAMSENLPIRDVVTPSESSLLPQSENSDIQQQSKIISEVKEKDMVPSNPVELLDSQQQNQNRRSSIRSSLIPQRRCSKIGVTNSVVKSLGLTNLDEISLEGIPLESWEVKARNHSIIVESLLSEEDNRRLQLANEVKRELNLSEDGQTENSPTPNPEVKDSSAPPSCSETSTQVQPVNEARVVHTEESVLRTEPPKAPSEEEGVIGWVKRRLSFKGNPEDFPPPSTLPQVSTRGEPTVAVNKSEETSSESGNPEGVVDWIKRRLSFQADPDPRLSVLPSNRSLSEPPTLQHEPKNENEESDGVVGWVKRRLSFRNETEIPNPPPSTLPRNSVAKLFSSDNVGVEDETAVASLPHTSHEVPMERSSESSIPQQKARKSLFGWLTRKNTIENTSIDTSWHPTSSSSSTSTSAVTDMTRATRSMSNSSFHGDDHVSKKSSQSRPSVQTIHQSKKVGFVRGFFEGLTGKKDDSKTKSEDRQNNQQKSQHSTLKNDEKYESYSMMKPEPSLGTDPITGRILYSYHELVRQNYLKEYSPGVDSQAIEEHLSEGEFLIRFNMTREEFYQLPIWKRNERKKNLKLF